MSTLFLDPGSTKIEIEQSISIIFQIVDFNRDGFISKSEIGELKHIVDSLR